MKSDVVIFWLVCLSCLSGLVVVATRFRSAGRGWSMVYLTILLVSVSGWVWEKAAFVYAGLAMWLLLVLLPGLLSGFYYHRFLRHCEIYADWGQARVVLKLASQWALL